MLLFELPTTVLESVRDLRVASTWWIYLNEECSALDPPGAIYLFSLSLDLLFIFLSLNKRGIDPHRGLTFLSYGEQ